MIDKVKRILAEQYGIENEADLLKAVSEMDMPDIGIFTSPCGQEESDAEKVS